MPLLHSAAYLDQFWRFLKFGAFQYVVDISADFIQSGMAADEIHDLGGDSSIGILQCEHELIQKGAFGLQGFEFALQNALAPLIAVFVDCAYRSYLVAVLARHYARALRFIVSTTAPASDAGRGVTFNFRFLQVAHAVRTFFLLV